ncbi:GAF domain-containing protein [Swingsia samuiensis]|uniref:GAF domain-containing protein n=2 Tax=Swingsia samuiensis TaxID=1293412 RepID=A0A4Y6ULU0_9PROT|nr:GAF domain-containing protein [Swingsia samuiensis]
MLLACDREPIHRPNAIQPHGLLLIAEASTLKIIAGAGDIEKRLIPNWLHQNASELLEVKASWLKHPEHSSLSPTQVTGLGGETFSILKHHSDGKILIELEPFSPDHLITWDIFSRIDATADYFEKCNDIQSVCEYGVKVFQKLVRFDRVMIYRFLDDGSGRVIAEKYNDKFSSLLNHHFPESDIPAQARSLYLKNTFRTIPSVHYTAAPIRPVEAGLKDLDLSSVQLRSVSPVHLRYMQNMGVAASASISIIVNNELWGLVTCHNATPKFIPENVRAACRTLAGLLARQIRNKAEFASYQERLHLKNIIETATTHFNLNVSIEQNAHKYATDLQRVFPCDGFAVIGHDRITSYGHIPSDDILRSIQEWLTLGSNGGIFYTSSLQEDYPPAKEWPEISSGILAITLPFKQPLTLLWNRTEIIQTVEWAGNPHKGEPDQNGVLHPRHSFDTWRQSVYGQSAPWGIEQRQAARRLKNILFSTYQTQQLRELNTALTSTLQERESLLKQKDFLIQEVNHRVQNSLQMVASFLKLQARTTENTETTSALIEAQHRIAAIGLVHRRLYQDDNLEIVSLDRYLEDLLRELLASLGPEWHTHLTMHIEPISVTADRAINVGLILTELIINISKYAYNGEAGPIIISLRKNGKIITLEVCDQGDENNIINNTGFGTRMMKAIINSLSGTLTYQSTNPGLKALVTVPVEAKSK